MRCIKEARVLKDIKILTKDSVNSTDFYFLLFVVYSSWATDTAAFILRKNFFVICRVRLSNRETAVLFSGKNSAPKFDSNVGSEPH